MCPGQMPAAEDSSTSEGVVWDELINSRSATKPRQPYLQLLGGTKPLSLYSLQDRAHARLNGSHLAAALDARATFFRSQLKLLSWSDGARAVLA